MYLDWLVVVLGVVLLLYDIMYYCAITSVVWRVNLYTSTSPLTTR